MRSAALLALLLTACAPSQKGLSQEPVAVTAYLPPPNQDNPVELGSSIPTELRADAVAIVASQVAGRLPGVRFLVIQCPVLNPSTNAYTAAFRHPGERAYAVIGWAPAVEASWQGPVGSLCLPGLEWEVDHLVAGTDDNGDPWPGSVLDR
jgi:hypothetical protein